MRKLFFRAVAAWLLWRAFGPESKPRFSGIQERPLRVPGRTVFVGAHEFFVRELGPKDGPPVVLIHGWAYDGEATWAAVAPLLAERHRVVLADQRNHGKSDRIRGPYDIEDVADELAGVLDALDLGPATIVGYSMGGMVAQMLTKRHPRHVRRLVLAGTAAYPIAARRLLTRWAFWWGRAAARVSPGEGNWFALAALRKLGAISPQHERWIWEKIMDRDPTLYYEAGNAVRRFDSRAWIGRLDVPKLVIIPTDDILVPPAAQYEMASLLDDCEVIELVGANHDSVLTRAEDYAKAIERFAGG